MSDVALVTPGCEAHKKNALYRCESWRRRRATELSGAAAAELNTMVGRREGGTMKVGVVEWSHAFFYELYMAGGV